MNTTDERLWVVRFCKPVRIDGKMVDKVLCGTAEMNRWLHSKNVFEVTEVKE